jgi:hypothetical protein
MLLFRLIINDILATPLHLRIKFNISPGSIKFTSIHAIAIGWQQQEQTKLSISESNKEHDLDFHYAPVPDGQGRVLYIYFNVENANKPGSLETIELNIQSFTSDNTSSITSQVNMKCAPKSTTEQAEVKDNRIDGQDLDQILQEWIDQNDSEIQECLDTSPFNPSAGSQKIQRELSNVFAQLLESNQTIRTSNVCHLSVGALTEKSKHANVSAPLHNGKECRVDLNLHPTEDPNLIELAISIMESGVSNTHINDR